MKGEIIILTYDEKYKEIYEKKKKSKTDLHYLDLYFCAKEFDLLPEQILKLIRYSCSSVDKYIVFINYNLELDWVSFGKYTFNNEKQKNILSKCEILQHYPEVYYFSFHQKIAFISLLAEAWVYSLETSYEEANNILTNAEKYLEGRSFEITRNWQLKYGFFIIFFFYFLNTLIWLNIELLPYKFLTSETIKNYIIYSMFSVMGSFFPLY